MDRNFVHPSRLGTHGLPPAPPPLQMHVPGMPPPQHPPFMGLPPVVRMAPMTVSTLDRMDLGGAVPYPEGYVPSALSAKEKKKRDKEKERKKESGASSFMLPPKPMFGSSAAASSSTVSTLYAIPKNKMDEGKVTKKKKKILRAAGGEVWEDETMQEWDPNDFRIFCGDLGNEVSDELLTRTFSKYPSFVKARVVRDKKTTKTKGYGFVSFKDPNDFVAALRELDGKYVGNRPIKLRKSNWDDRNVEMKNLRKVVTGGVVKKQVYKYYKAMSQSLNGKGPWTVYL
ncbi:hypothetical protein HDU78_010831 [Chytriomyces hyalinus]|nr:hypothetical protein HDU78_010831 [Chytriomyces hyalinus]